MKYIINNYNFLVLTINIALVVLLFFMFLIYWNYPVKKTSFPYSMTTCPDNWEITGDGRCIIPNPDDKHSNIGKLVERKYDIYKTKKNNKILLQSYDSNGVNNNDSTKLYMYDISGTTPLSAYDQTKEDESIDFYSKDWSRLNGANSRVCQVQKWINKYNIQWDGVTQYNQCNIKFDANDSTPIPTASKKIKLIPSENSNRYGEKNDIFFIKP